MVSSVGPQILVVEDDTAVRNLISTTLDSCGYRHISATTGHAAIAAAATQNPSVMPFVILAIEETRKAIVRAYHRKSRNSATPQESER